MTPHKILLFALCLLFVSVHADLCNFSPVCFNIATHYKLGRNFATGLPQLQLFKQIQSVPDPSYGLVYNVDFYPNNTKLPPAYCNGVTTCSEAIRYESKYIEVLEAYMAILDDSTQALTYVNVFPATGVVSHTLVQQLPFESDLAFKSPKVGASIESSSKIAVEATCPTGCMKDVSGYQMGLNEDHFFIIFYNQAGKQVLNANFGETAQNVHMLIVANDSLFFVSSPFAVTQHVPPLFIVQSTSQYQQQEQ